MILDRVRDVTAVQDCEIACMASQRLRKILCENHRKLTVGVVRFGKNSNQNGGVRRARRSLVNYSSGLRSCGVEVLEILSTRARSHHIQRKARKNSKQEKSSQEMSGAMCGRVHQLVSVGERLFRPLVEPLRDVHQALTRA